MSWHDALAFCAWLSDRWRGRLPPGWSVTLPSEAEWEKAARGGERLPAVAQVTTVSHGLEPLQSDAIDNPFPRRTYPWGDEYVEGNANVDMALGSTNTPDCLHGGRSPYGCEDMAGNVWESTRSLWGKDWAKPDFGYPYDPNDSKREALDAEDDVLRVVRGGSFDARRSGARCASRVRWPPDGGLVNIGFRVVLRPPPVS